MADGQGRAPPPDPQAMARDWITIWQSELTALATDREVQEGWARLVGLWAQAAETAARFLPGDPAGGHAGTAAPPGAQAPMAAPDPRDATIQRLAERVAELERRIAHLIPGDAARDNEGTGGPGA